VECKYAIEAALDAAGKARAAKSDANHFLYLVKAAQIFVSGGGNLVEGLKKIDAPVLLITSDDDLIFPPDAVNQTAQMIKADGTPVEQVKIKDGHDICDRPGARQDREVFGEEVSAIAEAAGASRVISGGFDRILKGEKPADLPVQACRLIARGRRA
jgi:pimeloyl-ACP methyl ester carboxylesterase